MLIRDTDILRKYGQISGTWNFADAEASLRMVEIKYIIPILSKELYNVLNTAISDATADDPLNPDFEELLHHCRMAIAPLFCYFHADKADVQFSTAGMQRSESSTNKNAYQEQRQKFKDANLTEGEDALELLQQYIETNREDYPEWLDSDNFKKYKSLFIKSGAEFNDLFPSHTPCRNYFLLRAKMFDVEENNIRPFLGDELFTALKTEDAKKDPVFSDEQKLLLQKLKSAIANLAVAFAAPFLNVRISSNGLTVPAIATFSTNDNENTRSGVADKMLSTFISSCTAQGTSWLTNAEKYLTNNKTTFPTWIGFVVPVPDCTEPDNDYETLFGM